MRLALLSVASYPDLVRTLSVKLPEALAEWLESESRNSRHTRSEIVRQALEARRSGPVKRARSLADGLLTCGDTFEGPGDLSTNPSYLDDLGK